MIIQIPSIPNFSHFIEFTSNVKYIVNLLIFETITRNSNKFEHLEYILPLNICKK